MEKRITASELFEMIRKGEQPDEIKCNGNNAVWDKKEFCYRSRRNGAIFLIALSKRVSGYPITYDEPILDKAERKYLSDVIRPFRSSVSSIKKKRNSTGEYLVIYVNVIGYSDNASLPDFKVGTMYKGMEREKPYTIEELGL